MNCHELNAHMHAYLDGTIEPDLGAEVDGHLKDCDACARRFRRAASPLEGVATLPRSIEPPSDLWPAIKNRIDEQRVVKVPFAPGAAGRRRWPVLAAAAVALVVLSSAVTTMMVRRPGLAIDSVRPATSVMAPVITVEAEYIRATEDLMTQLRARRSRLSPATVQVVERNLDIIDRAIAESRDALRQDPGNRALGGILMATYQRKLDLLRGANQAAES